MTPEQLKASILQLAIQGKLVEQRHEEGTAEDLYFQIQDEKAKLIKEGKLKKEKSLAPIEDDEIPFDIPENWKWCKLGDLTSYAQTKNKISGRALNGSVFSLDLEDIEKDTGSILNFMFSSEREIKGDKTKFCKGDILYSKLRPYLRKILIAPQDGICSSELVPFSCYKQECNLYLIYLLKSSYIDYTVNNATYGMKMPRVSTDTMVNLLVPLPPLAEQKRIVAKVEELLPLVEKYKKAYSELEILNSYFSGDMKKSILQYAIQGKLVEQRPEEGTAEDLYQQIQEEKQNLIKEGKLKKEKPLTPIEDDEIPFDIPEDWKWVRLRSIVFNHGQKTPNQNFMYIEINSIDNTTQKLTNDINIVTPEKAPSRARKIVCDGDILYATVRPYLHNMCIVEGEFQYEPIASTGFAVMTCIKGVLNKYLFYSLLSPFFDKYANDSENSKGISYPAINDEKLYKALIPLPPLAEQKRIVAKVEELLALCDKLKLK